MIGLWSLLCRGVARYSSVPLEAVLLGAAAAYTLRRLLTDRANP